MSYSRRRMTRSKGVKYDGVGYVTPKVETPVRAVPEGTPGSVVCQECGTNVMALGSDATRPVSHTPGGHAVNPKKGRYACPNSGSVSAQYSVSQDLPLAVESEGMELLEEFEARKRGLINIKIVANRYDITKTTLYRLIDKGLFIKHTAYLRHDETGRLQKLFPQEAVAEYMRARRIRRRVRTDG